MRLLLVIITDRTALIGTYHTRAGSAGTPSSCIASGNTTILWPPTVTAAAWRACLHNLLATLRRLVTSRPSLLGVSAQIQGVGVPAGDSIRNSQSHSLDGVAEMVVTAADATVSNVSE